MNDERETREGRPHAPPAGTRVAQREKQAAHGAQSGQGGKGQALDHGGGGPRAREGPEESSQQRR